MLKFCAVPCYAAAWFAQSGSQHTLHLLSILLACRSSSVAAAAVTALSRLLPVLHPSDWSNKEVLVNLLYNTLMDCCCAPGSSTSSDSTGELAAAVAEAVGYVGVVLLQFQHDDALFGQSSSSSNNNSRESTDRSLALGCSCLGMLLSCLQALWAGQTSGQTSTKSLTMQQAVSAVLQQLPASCVDFVMVQELSFSQVGFFASL
jgi:hypothetical protein